ncbi:putative proteasome inhibitor [Chloropicon primus]|uniref:Uncharacterized protein n=1 Tax=Chloropicon primus TaxID=1764295 RepID=A0A5B8MFQ0_9CHLO|nr:hypothetical protein A3770_02p18210 [Chloropicon primus]UPQ98512.1 putative proteasome inhibitor [Chloropicon primus]|eukprot:QDZ19303.1 hypothetical protein A3770_02p18210 [Chloropicon primus]
METSSTSATSSLALAVKAVLSAGKSQLRNEADKVVFALHTCLQLKGYRLIAVGRDASTFDGVCSKSEEVEGEGWNALEKDYSFAYVPKGREGVRVLVKCSVLGSSVCVAAIAKGTSSEGEAAGGEGGREPVTTEYDVHSCEELDRLVSEVCALEGSVKSQYDSEDGQEKGQRSTPSSGAGPPPSSGVRPGFFPGAAGSLRRDRVPYVGADDLVPPGIRAPGMPGMGPFPGPLGGPMRGSQVGPGDPIFGNRGMRFGQHIPPSNLRVPPGARYDPIHPPGVPDPDFGFGGVGEGESRIHPDIGRPPEGPGGSSGGHMDFMFG